MIFTPNYYNITSQSMNKKKNKHAQEMARLRAKKLSPERRREIALKAVAQREKNRAERLKVLTKS